MRKKLLNSILKSIYPLHKSIKKTPIMIHLCFQHKSIGVQNVNHTDRCKSFKTLLLNAKYVIHYTNKVHFLLQFACSKDNQMRTVIIKRSLATTICVLECSPYLAFAYKLRIKTTRIIIKNSHKNDDRLVFQLSACQCTV